MSEEYYSMEVIGGEKQIKEFEEILEDKHLHFLHFGRGWIDTKDQLVDLENGKFSMEISGAAKWSIEDLFLKDGSYSASFMSEFIYNNPLIVRNEKLTRKSHVKLFFGLMEMKTAYNNLKREENVTFEEIQNANKFLLIIDEILNKHPLEDLPTKEEVNFNAQNKKKAFLESVGSEDDKIISMFSEKEIREIRERINFKEELELEWLNIVEKRIEEVKKMDDFEVNVPYSEIFGNSEEIKRIRYAYNGWDLEPKLLEDNPFSSDFGETSGQTEEKRLNKVELLKELNNEIRSIKRIQTDILETSERLGLTIEIHSNNDELFISEKLVIKEGEIVSRTFIPSRREAIEEYYYECKSNDEEEREYGFEQVERTVKMQNNFLSRYE